MDELISPVHRRLIRGVDACFKGGSQKVTQNTVAEPPAFQKPYLEYGMEQAKNLYTDYSPIVGYTTNTILNPKYTGPTTPTAFSGWNPYATTQYAEPYAATQYRFPNADDPNSWGGAKSYGQALLNYFKAPSNPYAVTQYAEPYADEPNSWGGANSYLEALLNYPKAPAEPKYITKQTPIYGDPVGGKLQYYQGKLVADPQEEQAQAEAMLKDYLWGNGSLPSTANNVLAGMLTSGPSGLVKRGRSYLRDVMGGKYLPASTFEDSSYNPGAFVYKPKANPYYDRIVEKAMGAANANATQYGAYGSSDWMNLRGTTAKDLYADQYNQERQWYEQRLALAKQLYENRWNQERGNQQQAAGMVPAMDGAGWAKQKFGLSMMPAFNNMNLTNFSALENIGLQKQAQQQREIDAAKAKWDWEQMEPWKRLELYQQAVTGNMGENRTTTQPTSGTNPFTGAIGGALAGGMLGTNLATAGGATLGIPGALAGGTLGLLGSLF